MNLEDTLRDRFAQASEGLSGRPLDWAETHARARRGRTVYLAAVAFGTMVVLAAGGFAWSMLEGRDGGGLPIPPASTESPSPTPSPSPSDELTGEQEVSYEAPYRAVENFIQAAAEGEPEAMWGEMTDFSKAAYDHDFQRFRESALSEIQEGWGSWASADDLGRHWQVIASSGDGVMGVVTLMGSRAPEGNEEPYASAAIPVRVDREGNAKVELFVTRGVFEYQIPRDRTVEQPPALDSLKERNTSFDVLVPAGSTQVSMVVAPVPDEPAFSASGEADLENAGEDQVRATWVHEGRLFGGEWFLTVVAVYENGSMQAQSLRFAIE
ncbi:MAG: hypothetical protein GEU78_06305 [Actinobacteria bacterium]|nr:hypothetical protein [Actinomycetota bacterium]